MPKTSHEMSMWLREEQKAQPPGGTSYGWGGGPVFSDAFKFRRAPSLPALAEAYKSIIYTCVGINSDAVSRVSLRLVRVGQSKGDRAKYCNAVPVDRASVLRLKKLSHTAKAMAGAAEVEEITGEHPLLKLIQDVNPAMDQAQLIHYTVMSMDIVGTAFWWPTEFLHGCPREFWPLPPHLVYPEMATGGLVPSGYSFGSVLYRPEDLLIFKHLSMKNPYGLGMSPTQAAIEHARLEDTYISVADDMISNGPRPSVVISHKDPQGAFGDKERKRLEHDMNSKGRGGRAGSAFVVDGAVSVTPISYSPADLGSLEMTKQIIEQICGCFRVPVSMITNESSNRAVAEAGLVQHARAAVEPRCKAIASALTRWTHAQDRTGNKNWSKLFWVFDDCVPEDEQAKADLATKWVAMGWPINAALTDSGRDAIEGGDVSFVASGLQTIENAVKPPEPPPVPGQEPGAEGEGAPKDAEAEPEDDPDPDPDPEPAEEPESKAFDPIEDEILEVMAGIEAKLLTLGDTAEADRFADLLEKAERCRDDRGRFASCGTGGTAKPNKPAKPGKKPAAKPAAAKPEKKPTKPAKKPRETKPKEPKPDKKPAEPKKPAEKKPPKEQPAPKPEKPKEEPKPTPKPKPEKPAAKPEKPPEPKPKPAEKPKPEPAKPKPASDTSEFGTNFGPSKATVTADRDLTPAESKAQLDKAKRILGPHATDADIASIAGAPDNAKVNTADPGFFTLDNTISIHVRSPEMTALRKIERSPGGELTIKNEYIYAEKTGTGVGAKAFGRQVEAAVRMGATKITTQAARSREMNGYITWPKLGYDAPIPVGMKGAMPTSLKSSKNISDLMKTKEGTAWWTKHGVTTDMTFDLRPGSPSRTHLAKYLEAKGYGR